MHENKKVWELKVSHDHIEKNQKTCWVMLWNVHIRRNISCGTSRKILRLSAFFQYLKKKLHVGPHMAVFRVFPIPVLRDDFCQGFWRRYAMPKIKALASCLPSKHPNHCTISPIPYISLLIWKFISLLIWEFRVHSILTLP